jgi:signal transduction histidine kinase
MLKVRSLRWRLTLWGGLGFAAVTVAFVIVLHLSLESQLLEKACSRNYPDLPEWRLHNSLTEAEVQQIGHAMLRSALLWLIPVVALAVIGGYLLARQSMRPIANVNRQLQAKHPGNLGEPITLPELDYEFRDLVRQLNDLLTRLDGSFEEMNNYAAKVAHELRTPITILRLKIEQAGDRIDPELADELEGELHRLAHVVEQSLLIARAEQGRVMATRVVFNLAETIREVVEDFQLLAAEQDRQLVLRSCSECWVSADPRHVRQITHTLLTNALKHGSGGLTVRLKPEGKSAVLLVANPTSRDGTTEPTLGLGLRVVTALLRLEPGLALQRRHTPHYHVARLLVPRVEHPISFQI